MADVFISYKRQDRPKVERVAQCLRDLGYSVWFDASLTAGEAFDDEIEREVHSARAVLVLWSHQSIKSRWVKNEAGVGIERGVLIAARVEECKPPFAFRDIHCNDIFPIRTTPAEPGWSKIVERVATLTHRMPRAPASMEPKRPPPPLPLPQTVARERTAGEGAQSASRRALLFGVGGTAVVGAAAVVMGVVNMAGRREPAPSSPMTLQRGMTLTPLGEIDVGVNRWWHAYDDTPFSADGLRIALPYEPTTGNSAIMFVDVETRSRASGGVASVGNLSEVIAFSPDGRSIACGVFRRMSLFDVATGARLWTNRREDIWYDFLSIDFSPDSRWIAATTNDGGVSVLDAATGRLVKRLPQQGINIDGGVAFSPDGVRIACASDSAKRAYLYDFASGAEVASVACDDSYYQWSPQFSLDGALLIFQHYRKALIRSAENLASVREIAGRAFFAGSGSRWVVVENEGVVTVYDRESWQVLTTTHIEGQLHKISTDRITLLSLEPLALWRISES